MLKLLFAAAQSFVVAISNTTVNATRIGASTTATYQLENDGGIGVSNANGTSIIDGGNWVTPAGASVAALFECRATVISGSLTSGTTGSWLALDTTRTWTLGSGGPPGSQTCVFTLEIRRASDGVVVDSADITLEAESEL